MHIHSKKIRGIPSEVWGCQVETPRCRRGKTDSNLARDFNCFIFKYLRLYDVHLDDWKQKRYHHLPRTDQIPFHHWWWIQFDLFYFVVLLITNHNGIFLSDCTVTVSIPVTISALNNNYFSFRIDLENVRWTPTATVTTGPRSSILHPDIINLGPTPD